MLVEWLTCSLSSSLTTACSKQNAPNPHSVKHPHATAQGTTRKPRLLYSRAHRPYQKTRTASTLR